MTEFTWGDFRSAAGLVALQSLPRVGPASALRAALHSASEAELVGRHADALGAAFERARRQLWEYERAGVHVLGFFDDGYPDRLRELRDPPPVLYVRGDVSLLSRDRLIAVVGTREPTVFGTTAGEHLTTALVDRGWAIVSGLAKGIDTIAHRVAVGGGAPTVAVMGGGLDRVYPAENKRLAALIVDQGGALVAEQPFGAQPRANNLIARDRLQSGLSAAVLVVQCGLRSGTLHTARFAAEQGRALFCPVPQGENGASDGVRALLERPASELCGLFPAWRSAHSLCARLGDQPLAHPVRRDALDEFLHAAELAERWPTVNRDQHTLLPTAVDTP